MKKTLLSIAVLASIIIPSVTFAAWYNPVSWFKKAPVSVVAPVEPTPEVASVPAPTPKPVVTNNIIVSDPKLQSQINTLVQQNATLQTQLASLTAEYNIVVADNAKLKAQVITLQTPIEVVTPVVPNQTASVRIGTPTIVNGASSQTSYPVYINNQSDKSVSISSITYKFDLFNIQSNAGQGSDYDSVNHSGGKFTVNSDSSNTYTFLNPIVLPANFTSTIYINTDITQNNGTALSINDLKITKVDSVNPNVTFKI